MGVGKFQLTVVTPNKSIAVTPSLGAVNIFFCFLQCDIHVAIDRL